VYLQLAITVIHYSAFAVLLCAYQVVICEGCRFASHQTHQHDFVANLASAERARLREIGQQCRDLSTALEGRSDALSASSEKCASAADSVKQEITREFDRARAALLEREQQLATEVDDLKQVWGTDMHAHTLKNKHARLATFVFRSNVFSVLRVLCPSVFTRFAKSRIFPWDCRVLRAH